jgi:chromosome segregation ATPase
MKDQNKELKINKKRLEKLEEKFVKVNTDLKNIINDKANIEDFISNIFPKDMISQVLKKEYGTYDKSELSKLWLIAESKNQSEYNNILTKLKSEINELSMKNKELNLNYSQITQEYDDYKKANTNSSEQLTKMIEENKELKDNLENLTSEKTFLMKILDEKTEQIQQLKNLELENAELKAKSLLNNDDGEDLNLYNLNLDYDNDTDNKKNNININNEDKNGIENPKLVVKIDSLNMGSQTDNVIYTEEEYEKLKNELEEYKTEINKLKKEFNDYKEKSHKVLLSNENNYKKVFKEYEKVKKELSQLLVKYNNDNSNNNNIIQEKKMPNLPNIQPASVGIDRNNFKNFDVNKRISKEYLKNVLLKYLEAIAIGNEFETKILENVLFTVLQVSKNEIKCLEDKRITSSFYYNLWYNAKAFLSSKIYGENGENIYVEEEPTQQKNGSGSILEDKLDKDKNLEKKNNINNNTEKEPINL